ncbi:MAG: general secretion pathway protein GspK [Kiritimatiellae bacterium]|nr:general secretion pathway protein GspK [Kiritimatiellia bacterium]
MARQQTDANKVPQHPPREGAVLVLVLVLLGLVAALVLEALVTARTSVRFEEHALRSARLRAALADAAREALQQLADDEVLQADHEGETWAAPVELKTPSGISIWVRVTDENRRFDLNNIHIEQAQPLVRPPADILMDILTQCGDFAPIERVQALADWIDPDDEGFRESPYYAQIDPPYACADTWLASRFELPLVAGFTRGYFDPPERYERAAFQGSVPDCVTVIPGERRKPIPVNINTAPREVLLGLFGAGQEALIQFITLTRKDQPFLSVEQIALVADPLVMDSARPYLDVRSNSFRIEARAFEEGQAERLWVLARRGDDGAVRVLQWVY